jgi:hypothetical protein
MEILLLAFLLACGKLILLVKFTPFRQVLFFDKWVDLFFTVVLPMAFYGTFSGMVTAVFSGLFLSLFLLIAKCFVKPVPPKWWPKKHDNETSCYRAVR